MSPEEFRLLALGLAGTVEGSHMDHADFRVGRRIFATLGYPAAGFAMVKLPPELQAVYVEAEPAIFSPVKGAWGRAGSTLVNLAAATPAKVEGAIAAAWSKTAPKGFAAAGKSKSRNRG